MRTALSSRPVMRRKPICSGQCELERRTAAIFDNTPFSVGEVEERLDLNGTQIARQSAPPQTRRMPVLHVPTLRESAYNTSAETPNIMSLRCLQILRRAARITEESYRHFWHVNQGEAYYETIHQHIVDR
jgi:hypothetical protein